ncbi:MAG TPA: hypothetical protein VFT43_09070 [Candidatus Polarisedimenticolia bacterium]|nr:hypothetical protein [Candidatus Polarisedimenticolia bacterium]
MEMDDKTIEELRLLEPRKAYDTVRRAVLQSPFGTSSEDLLAAMEQMVDAGILTWEQIEEFEEA